MQQLETTIISYLAHEPPVWAVFGQRRLMAAPASTGAAPLRVRGFTAKLAHSFSWQVGPGSWLGAQTVLRPSRLSCPPYGPLHVSWASPTTLWLSSKATIPTEKAVWELYCLWWSSIGIHTVYLLPHTISWDVLRGSPRFKGRGCWLYLLMEGGGSKALEKHWGLEILWLFLETSICQTRY